VNEDTIWVGDSRNLFFIEDGSVHLIVTSPPYNVGKEYEKDSITLGDWMLLMEPSIKEMERVLCDGGRLCINIADTGRRPFLSLSTQIINMVFERNFLMRGEIIWDKGASAQKRTSWGSWRSQNNPFLRSIYEKILVFSKGKYSRDENGRTTDLDRDEFLMLTEEIWRFPTERNREHPAPFPVELPRRCIKLYSFPGDIVCDPFVGSGSTCIAAMRTGRHYIGVDKDERYVIKARERVNAERRNG
jgi:DNA modification methylase